ncbi:uncharacterized protein TNCT_325651 [Trichonephila clavata]|uniref:Uncharacterized protein n=1 Tax=Trichonephila clavata TaxID=2740835 RepID=A0A8X6LQG2_TRICU|nr:uncharacterized protein TNCT_325651 [Trichonephila clavata]
MAVEICSAFGVCIIHSVQDRAMGVPCRRSSHLSTKWVLVFKRISCFLLNHDTAIKPLDGHPINATIYLHASPLCKSLPQISFTPICDALMNGSRARVSPSEFQHRIYNSHI